MASTIKVDTITTPDGTGNISVDRPLSGSGAGLTSLPAANISGVIPPANLGTGTASASTFLNGNGAYSEAGGGAWNVITSTNITSNVTSVEFTSGIDSTYASYAWTIAGLKPTSTGSNLYMYVKTNTGSYHTGGSDYKTFQSQSNSSSTSWIGGSSGGTSYLLVADQAGLLNMEMRLDNPTQTSSIKPFYWNGGHLNNSNHVAWAAGAGAFFGNNNAITAVKFDCGGGNITEGRITMYGIAHA